MAHVRDSGPSFEAAWRALDPPWQRSLELAYDSLRSGTLAVGSVLTDASGAILAEGRNRAYDAPGGSDVLQGTPLAHAEMNVLAAVRTGRELGDCVMWTTVEPCSMCRAAAAFTGVRRINLLAPDPWAIAAGVSGQRTGAEKVILDGPPGDAWQIAADVLFLMSVGIPGGADHPMLVANRRHEPEASELALRHLDLDTQRSLSEVLSEQWAELAEAADRRARRIGSD